MGFNMILVLLQFELIMCTYEHRTTCKNDVLCSFIHCLRKKKQAAKALQSQGALLYCFKQGEYSTDTCCFKTFICKEDTSKGELYISISA